MFLTHLRGCRPWVNLEERRNNGTEVRYSTVTPSEARLLGRAARHRGVRAGKLVSTKAHSQEWAPSLRSIWRKRNICRASWSRISGLLEG